MDATQDTNDPCAYQSNTRNISRISRCQNTLTSYTLRYCDEEHKQKVVTSDKTAAVEPHLMTLFCGA